MKKQYLYFLLGGLFIGYITISQAIIWPTTPVWENPWGIFMRYINNMFANTDINTTDGKVKKALSVDTLWSGVVLVLSWNIGIGTGLPQTKLDVNGWIRTSNLQITTNASSGHILVWDQNGNASWQPNNYRLKVKSLTPEWTSSRHTCVLMEDATVRCWWYNNEWQLWIWSNVVNLGRANMVAWLTGVAQLYNIWWSNLAVMQDGSIYTWWYNGYGTIGNGTTTNAHIPIKIPWVSNVTEWYEWHADGSGYASVCVKIGTGATSTAKCWWYNGYWQLGVGDTVQRNIPTNVVGLSNIKYIRNTGWWSGWHACALMNDGTVKCWGYNAQGQLWLWNTTNYFTPTTISWLSNVRDLYLWDGRTCVVLNDNTTLRCWGYNNYGQLWFWNTVQQNSPVNISTGGWAIKSINMNGYDYFANYVVFSDGTVKSTGYNGAWQLGVGDVANRSLLTTIPWLSGVSKVVSGGENWYQFACALMNDGTVKCWGHNNQWWLWLWDTNNRNVPTTVLWIKDAIDIAAYWWLNTAWNEARTCALLSNGSIQCWGYNGHWQIWQQDTLNYTLPQSINNLNTD